MKNKILLGLIFALIANAGWGASFVVSKVFPDLRAAEIVVGRYLVYGVVSIVLLLPSIKQLKNYTSRQWLMALIISITGSVGSYLFTLIAIQLTDATVVLVVLAVMPVTCSIYGNIKSREFRVKDLILPLVMILAGIVLINVVAITGLSGAHWNFVGLLCAVGAVLMYTYYYVENARFLKNNPTISPQLWAKTIGITNLLLLPLVVVLANAILPDSFQVGRFFAEGTITLQLWSASIVLGVVLSYICVIFWNKASTMLPTSIVGLIIVTEVLFGLLYSFLLDTRLPTIYEVLGIVLVLIGVVISIRKTQKLKSNKVQE